jgi:transposase InsO family protein
MRDRDAIFGDEFRKQLRGMGICEVLSAPRSPWQRAYVERVIGSVRRECLDHVIVFHECSLRRILTSYFDYYHRSRTHLSLGEGLTRATSDSTSGNGIRRGWCRRSADCTTATNDGLPERVRIHHVTHYLSLWPFAICV